MITPVAWRRPVELDAAEELEGKLSHQYVEFNPAGLHDHSSGWEALYTQDQLDEALAEQSDAEEAFRRRG